MEAKQSKDERSEKFEQNDIQDHQETPSDAAADDSSAQTDALPQTYFEEVQRTGDVLEVIATDVREWLKTNGHSDMGRYLIMSCWEHSNALDKELRSATEETEESTAKRTSDRRRLELDMVMLDPEYLRDLFGEIKIDAERLLFITKNGDNDYDNCFGRQQRIRAIEHVLNELRRTVQTLVDYSNSEPE